MARLVAIASSLTQGSAASRICARFSLRAACLPALSSAVSCSLWFGTANLFVFFDIHRGWRRVKVTEHRTARDFAQCMRELIDAHYPEADQVRVVLDNLSTHSRGALYETFAPPEAHRSLEKIELHYTPKHASWLDKVEIEIGVLRDQCLDRRIPDRDRLVAEIAAWERQRNAVSARINWMFSTERARSKLARAYPTTVND